MQHPQCVAPPGKDHKNEEPASL
uniref:Uncharacterized protein n=1 Tax=Arundo donax TaxID=35708 RepID=A0A0A8Z8Z5_ARUDO